MTHRRRASRITWTLPRLIAAPRRLTARFPGCLGLVPWLCCDMNSGKRAKVGAMGRLTRLVMLVLGILSVPSVGLGAMQRSHCTQHEPSAGAHSGHEQMPDPRTSWEALDGT